MPTLLVTGANGHLGRRLIRTLSLDWSVEAVVRSERARRLLERHAGDRPGVTITPTDPADAERLAPIAERCDAAVHLIGTIRETRENRYVDSHETPARAVAAAAARAGLERLVYLSILGANAGSDCRCLRARAAVETIVADAAATNVTIRVPMVLGEKDRASGALARRAAAGRVFLFRAGSLEQPIYAGDVIAAIVGAIDARRSLAPVHDLAGPESLSRAALVHRAAASAGRTVRIHSLPLAFGLMFAGVMETLSPAPPITRDMLRVLDHDDAIDPQPAADALGITLTALDEMLERCVAARLAQPTME